MVPGEPVPFGEAILQIFEPFAIGTSWGPPWSTMWLHITGTVPAEWVQHDEVPEVVIDLGFVTAVPGFQAEGTAYTPQGAIIKAVESRNQYLPVGAPGSPIDFYLEAAANPDILGSLDFFPTQFGDKSTAGTADLYRLMRVDIALRNLAVWELRSDFTTLLQLAEQVPASLPRRGEIIQAMERAADALDPNDVRGTATDAREALATVLEQPAHATAHRVSAVGHAHIDSAWLWPIRETVRKVARTFSNVLALMDDDPDFVFAASSAQQYAWLQQYYPELFARVKQRVAEGRFVPVGGMWVESDTNLPGGEALARQFIVGKRYFIEELGVEPVEVWLPDSFGYSGSLPQIVVAAGSRWFLTQKISWNETNRMPHHTFWWEGIDGTRVFTHFPPADTYNAELTAAELALAQSQYGEKGKANSSLIPFGYGDGGGGPTREMLASARRFADLEGSPRVEIESPAQFFERAEHEYAAPPVWRGELYLEAHRGTYTSQANMKSGNRRSEHLLREAELWAATRSVRLGDPYPYDELDDAWRTVLLQQFHDILPGSGIAWVHHEAERKYAEVAIALERLIAECTAALSGAGPTEYAFNAGPYAVDGAIALGSSPVVVPQGASTARRDGDTIVMENSRVRATIDNRGLLVSLVDIAADRELIPADSPANLLQLFRDTPTLWDAWDIDSTYTHTVSDLTDVDSIDLHDAVVTIGRSFGASTVVQRLWLDEASGSLQISTRVDWHEAQKLLKLAFPLDVFVERAASEIQFGHIYRPTHANTSWDAARFETVAHRWVHVGEAGYGVAIANDSVYGHDIRSTQSDDGKGRTVVRLSLLRAPLYPDPASDQGVHEFTVAVRTGAAISDAVALGYRLNLPLRQVHGDRQVEPLVGVDNPAVVVEAVKLAEDRSGDVVIRLYEALGTRARARVDVGFPVQQAVRTDLLERTLDQLAIESGAVSLELRPFEIVTLRLSR
ncbi:glycoside hydrolase family 38 C-terminal domain-containing protein [soil metagenome]